MTQTSHYKAKYKINDFKIRYDNYNQCYFHDMQNGTLYVQNYTNYAIVTTDNSTYIYNFGDYYYYYYYYGDEMKINDKTHTCHRLSFGLSSCDMSSKNSMCKRLSVFWKGSFLSILSWKKNTALTAAMSSTQYTCGETYRVMQPGFPHQ